MGDFEDDIERYRMGLLSKKEMHRLEKKALNDPFLADALEGAESIGQEDFSLDIRNFQQQFSKKKRNWWPLGIAASFLVLTLSYFIFKPSFNLGSHEQLTQSKTESQKRKTDKTELLNDSVNESKPTQKLLTYDTPRTKRSKSKAPYITLDGVEQEVAAAPALAQGNTGFEPAQRIQIQDSIYPEKEVAKASSESEEARPIPAESKKSEVSEVTNQLSQRAKHTSKSYAIEPSITKGMKTLSGKISSTDDGSPIPGVSITLPNAGNGFISDAEGNYSITIPDSTKQVSFSFIGLQTQQFDLKKESQLDVKMSADVTQLSEVVVVGYGISQNTDDQKEKPLTIANPVGGRRAYNKYLEKKLKYPEKALKNKIEGKVTVQFKVSLQGSLTDFSVVRSLGYGCDEEVMRLIKEGPKWNPTMQADIPLESTVRVRLKFRLPK